MYGSNIYRPIFVFTCLKIFSDSDSVMAEKLDYTDVSSMKSEIEKSLFFGTTFVCCPWKKFRRPGLFDLAKWKLVTPNNGMLPEDDVLDKVLKIHEVDPTKINHPPVDKIQVTWIGHATVLVQFDGISILSDPVFLDYCGPNRMTSYKRYRKAACEIKDIMKLDAVVISHNHYDHLETAAVQEIDERFPEVKWFVTLKQKEWLAGKGVKEEQILELDWWEDKKVSFGDGKFTFTCTPAQHWCARLPTINDNKCLWCSWVIKGPKTSYYFAGDTGYYEPLFKAIGEKYGPFQLAAIPIGAYEPRFITEYQHVDPAEAVKIHKDIKAVQSLGMHWGTFALSNEFFVEPPQKVEEEMKKQKLDPEKFISLCHGETWCVGDERVRPPFMTYKKPGHDDYSEDISYPQYIP